MWLPETSFDIRRHWAWKPVSIKDVTGQKPSPSTMSIPHMPAVGAAAALGRASSCTRVYYRESNVLISDFLKLLPEINTRHLLQALVTRWQYVAGMQMWQ